MADATPPIVDIRGLTKTFRAAGRQIRALDGVDLTLAPVETLGIVGESGSGKSTIGRILAGLETATGGEIRLAGQDLRGARGAAAKVQMIFQDPYASLNPRMPIGLQIHETLRGSGHRDRVANLARAAELLARVGLPPDALQRYAHEFSGGQRQRIAIARAMSTDPAVIVADEPVSALDVSIRGQILDLMRQMKGHTACLFISHDMAAVASLCDRILVLNRGRVVETGPTAQIISNPRDPYTRALLEAIPRIGRRRTGTGSTPMETLA
ncbi:ABC transporter ATP-binding protein [Xinfangfangia pollutisoli]|uniref:ABC transporter ATP-binding protein n=1 Tax=Xinfangfangia pollutisoli TaxID=2865960 RepID=UPI001CD3D8AA|nr:ATP-binding cassette domain-containing protein [Xinfangfangia pollutisoli]